MFLGSLYCNTSASNIREKILTTDDSDDTDRRSVGSFHFFLYPCDSCHPWLLSCGFAALCSFAAISGLLPVVQVADLAVTREEERRWDTK